MSALQQVTLRVDNGLGTVGGMAALAVQATLRGVRDAVRGAFPWFEFVDQCWFMIRVSLLPTLLVAIPFGVVTSIQVGSVANAVGAQSFIGAVNGIGVLRQAAPIVSALIIAGVVGAAICADLGTRAVREEIDAMRVMGVDPVRRLVAPRILAAVVVSLILNALVAMTAIATGFVLDAVYGSVSAGTYLQGFVSMTAPMDLWLSAFKAGLFGFLATVVASHKGLAASGGPKGVADAVNQTVVLGVILLAGTNAVLTQLYVMFFPGAA